MYLSRTIIFFAALAATGLPSAEPADRAAVIAQRYVGAPYHYGGATPRGFDCSGLVHYAYRQAGIGVPRTVARQQAITRPISPRQLRKGDLLFFRLDRGRPHVGIYLGHDRFVHAPSRGKQVEYADFRAPYWQAHFVRAGRILLAPGTVTAL